MTPEEQAIIKDKLREVAKDVASLELPAESALRSLEIHWHYQQFCSYTQ